MKDYRGLTIDRYHIIEKLGQGGMAVVYKAFDTRLERDAAIKFIRVEEFPPSQLERLLKRFEREAKSQARFSHPNIIQVFDYGEYEGVPYLVLEYLSGGSLRENLKGMISVDHAIEVLVPIADGLGYAHDLGVIHRDVKPANILFNQLGRSMITDFGIAKLLEGEQATLTGTGLGIGTPEYMAPEQWKGITLPQSDIYALGVVFYEMLTGKKPYTADTPIAIAIMQLSEPLRRPSEINPAISEATEKIIFKALAKQPENRYETMRDFQNALSGLRNQKEGSITEKKNSHKSTTLVDYTQFDLEGEFDGDDELTIDENINPIEIVEDKKEKNPLNDLRIVYDPEEFIKYKNNHEKKVTTDKNDSFDKIRISHTNDELIISENDQKLADSIELSSNKDKNTNDDHKEDENYSKIFFYIALFIILVIIVGFSSN